MAGPARRPRGDPRRNAYPYIGLERDAHGDITRARQRTLEKEAADRWNSWADDDKTQLLNHVRAYNQEIPLDRAIRREHDPIWQQYQAATAVDERLPLLVSLMPILGRMVAIQGRVRHETTWLWDFYRAHACSQALIEVAGAARGRAQRRLRRTANLIQTLPHELNILRHEAAQHGAQKVPTDIPRGDIEDILLRGTRRHNRTPSPIETVIPPGDRVGRWRGPFRFYYRHNTLITGWLLVVDGEIVDTAIRKDVDVHEVWSDAINWDNARDVANRQHYEFLNHRNMANALASSVLGLRGGGIDQDLQILTLYTEVAKYGTASGVKSACRIERQVIPEAFIWYNFLVLAECALAMQYGRLPPESEEQPSVGDWQPIVHADIKPMNVFLTDPVPDRFPNYPAPKLGDFGSSYQTFDQDPSNPELYANDAGTDGYRAPEQRHWWDPTTSQATDRWRTGAHTNVYAIGLTIQSLMLAQSFHAVEPRGDQEMNLWRTVAQRRERDSYSRTLIDLVERCLRYVPQHRITVVELHRAIRELLQADQDDDATMNAVRDLYRGRATEAIVDANTIYRTLENNDERPEEGGDARFQHGPVDRPNVINMPLVLIRRGRETENRAIGVRSSWWRPQRRRGGLILNA